MAWLQSLAASILVFIGSLVGFGYSHPNVQPSGKVTPSSPTAGPSSTKEQNTTAHSMNTTGDIPVPTQHHLQTPSDVRQTQPTVAPTNAGTSTGSVIGYVWQSDSGSPKFASVTLPPWGLGREDFNTREYGIYLFEGNNLPVLYQKARPVVDRVVFPSGGVSSFEVLGIDPRLGICGADRNVTWVMTFTQSGAFRGKRIPITTSIANPKCVAADATQQPLSNLP
jgi:hypothetical protein